MGEGLQTSDGSDEGVGPAGERRSSAALAAADVRILQGNAAEFREKEPTEEAPMTSARIQTELQRDDLVLSPGQRVSAGETGVSSTGVSSRPRRSSASQAATIRRSSSSEVGIVP